MHTRLGSRSLLRVRCVVDVLPVFTYLYHGFSVVRATQCLKISHQWAQTHAAGCAKSVSVRPAEHQQPQLRHYAGPNHQGTYSFTPSYNNSYSTSKVLNMRPQEILGMVEEAAGTRMFEERKEAARKKMSKKDKRMQEVTSILNEEITPKLNKLREEKRSFLEFQKSEKELEQLNRVLTAWEFQTLTQDVENAKGEIEQAKENAKMSKKEAEKQIKEVERAEQDMHKVQKQRDAEMKKGGKLSQLEEEKAASEKEMVKLSTQEELMRGTISDEEAKIETSGEAVKRVRF